MIRAFRRNFRRNRINRESIGRRITIEIFKDKFIHSVLSQSLTAFIFYNFTIFRERYNRLVRPLKLNSSIRITTIEHTAQQPFRQPLHIRKLCRNCINPRSEFVRYNHSILRRRSKRIRERISRNNRAVIVLFKQRPGFPAIRRFIDFQGLDITFIILTRCHRNFEFLFDFIFRNRYFGRITGNNQRKDLRFSRMIHRHYRITTTLGNCIRFFK